MTMADLLALGAPPLPPGHFYRVRSHADGFVFVQIRQEVTRSWRTFWRSSRLRVEVLCKRTKDARADVAEGCTAALAALRKRQEPETYWTVIAKLEGDHR